MGCYHQRPYIEYRHEENKRSGPASTPVNLGTIIITYFLSYKQSSYEISDIKSMMKRLLVLWQGLSLWVKSYTNTGRLYSYGFFSIMLFCFELGKDVNQLYRDRYVVVLMFAFLGHGC